MEQAVDDEAISIRNAKDNIESDSYGRKQCDQKSNAFVHLLRLQDLIVVALGCLLAHQSVQNDERRDTCDQEECLEAHLEVDEETHLVKPILRGFIKIQAHRAIK